MSARLRLEPLSALRPTPLPSRFGPWRFDESTLELVLVVEGRELYSVDLERCDTAAETLDWIMQVASKTWATPAVVAGLVEALDRLIEPQGTLCSFGVERGPIDPARVIRARLAANCGERRDSRRQRPSERASSSSSTIARKQS